MAAVCCPVKSCLQDLLNRNFARNTYDSRASSISNQVLCVSRSILSHHNQLQQRRTMNLDAESSGSLIGSGNSGNMEMYVSESDDQVAKRLRLQEEEDQRITENNQRIIQALLADSSENEDGSGPANIDYGSDSVSESEEHVERETEGQVETREQKDQRISESNQEIMQAILAYSSEDESVSESEEQEMERLRLITEGNQHILQYLLADSSQHEDGGGGDFLTMAMMTIPWKMRVLVKGMTSNHMMKFQVRKSRYYGEKNPNWGCHHLKEDVHTLKMKRHSREIFF